MTTPFGAVRRWRAPDTLRWGLGLAFATALISGLSVFVNGAAVRVLPDPAVYTTLKNGVAAALLIAIALASVRRAEVRALDRRAWITLVVIGVVGGSIPFLLFFSGLAQASAPTAAFIHKTLFVWVALLAVPVLGERLGLAQVGALGVLFAGQVLVVPPTGIRWGAGETMIAAATMLWAVESVVARRLLSRVSAPVPPQVLGAGRLGFGLVVLLAYLAITGRFGVVATLTATQGAVALGTGFLLTGYVVTWLAALRRAPASLVAAVLVVGAPITATLQLVVNGTMPTVPGATGLGLILAGALALVASAFHGSARSTEIPRARTAPG
ncbi:MAG: DMT family transporter [Chloroflexota bacterium]